MYAAVTGTGKNKSVYIIQSYRKENGRTSSRVYRKLGRLDALLEEYHGDKDKMMAWANAEAAKETQACRTQSEKLRFSFLNLLVSPKRNNVLLM